MAEFVDYYGVKKPGYFLAHSDIARGGGGKWGHGTWGAGLGGAPAHFFQSFKDSF